MHFFKRSSFGAEAMVRNASHDEEMRFFFLRIFERFHRKNMQWFQYQQVRTYGHFGCNLARIFQNKSKDPSIGNCTEFTFDFLQWCPFRISGILYLIFFWFTFFITFFTQKNHVLSSKTLKPSRVLASRGVKHIFVHSNLLPLCLWELSRKENVEGVSMGDLISFVILFWVEGSHCIILGIHTFM